MIERILSRDSESAGVLLKTDKGPLVQLGHGLRQVRFIALSPLEESPIKK